MTTLDRPKLVQRIAQDLLDASEFDPTDLFPRRRSDCSLSSSSKGSSWDWSDLFNGLDGDEWVAVIALVIALLAGVLASALIVASAPALLGEIFLDAVVVAALRRKMVRIAGQHWTWAALRRTAIPFVVVAVAFSAAGGVIHHVRPEAKSIGGIFHAERVER